MTDTSLSDLGWSDHFARQVTPDDTGTPARVTGIHRDRLDALGPGGPLSLKTSQHLAGFAVGDWLLHDGTVVTRLLERRGAILRKAAGAEVKEQLIAANVDTLAIVTSCNADFNIGRLERYLALAAQGDALPLIVLTKADLSDDPRDYEAQAARLSPLVTVVTLDAREEADRLEPWCRDGRTLALVGSSGVGKTTLQNALTGIADAVQGIREDDARGRHTTTSRALRPTLSGGWLIDTPGMREIQLADVGEAIDTIFPEIEELATLCRFRDCAHVGEPGCAVQAAIAAGDLDPGRLERWRKLRREDRHNSETVAQSRARFRALNKQYRGGKARAEAKRSGRAYDKDD
ncbi:ribosome small subunit-dependent GTPase A [Wenxinia saemankumensis]|uniref:Small ribosomal subunit biogenesis GTPase RsgA n=1 Tax=Wenxinia saemankumensis TaxID=1447782 RepID=A0A1M6DUV4_9RHOB|nr:ribosome small subunit-dependent GTPase A [Wenxinia saemankumensis]SHI76981.1 ribosome biogenesis GTPase [Wenxinia saemankumensis]